MVTARGFTAVGDSRMSMAIFYIQLVFLELLERLRIRILSYVFQTMKFSLVALGTEKKHLAHSFYILMYILYMHIYTQNYTFYIYVHTQKKDTIKSSTMKKLNPPYPFVQA